MGFEKTYHFELKTYYWVWTAKTYKLKSNAPETQELPESYLELLLLEGALVTAYALWPSTGL